MPIVCGYKFRGIQEYIARGGRLIDIAGGSELIDSLCRSRLIDMLRELGIGGADQDGTPIVHEQHGCMLQADSGRVLILFHAEDIALRFTRLWPLVADRWAPDGRHAIDLRESDNENIGSAVIAVSDRIERGPELPLMAIPLANPLTLRERRTGLPVTAASDGREGIEDRDASSERRAKVLSRSGGYALKDRFGFGALMPSLDVDDIAEAGGSDILAVVHADGIRFGERFQSLIRMPNGVEATSRFSTLLRRLFRDAATYALQPVRDLPPRNNRIPCRPILLGGDDMTALVPGHYGLDVARRFLARLEQVSRSELPGFAGGYGLGREPVWQCLRAGAGVAFVHAHYPFDLALRLASTCADWAKSRLRAVDAQTSCLQFHVALDSATDDFDDIFRQQLRQTDRSGNQRELTAGPYVTDPVEGSRLATLAQLDALVDAVAQLPRRGWREVAQLVHEPDGVLAERRLQRQSQLLDAAQRTSLATALSAFGNADAIWSRGPGDVLRTPIQDVEARVGLERRFARANRDGKDSNDG